MPSLKKLLKNSVKAAKRGTLAKEPRTPVDLPKGVKLDAAGEFVLPESPGERADLLYAAKQMRYSLQHRVDLLQKLQTKLENDFIDTLPKSQASGLAGKTARVQIEVKPVPQVENWDLFYAYVGKNKAWELLQRRLSEGAAKERLEAGEGAKMGVTVFNAKKVSCTKI